MSGDQTTATEHHRCPAAFQPFTLLSHPSLVPHADATILQTQEKSKMSGSGISHTRLWIHVCIHSVHLRAHVCALTCTYMYICIWQHGESPAPPVHRYAKDCSCSQM